MIKKNMWAVWNSHWNAYWDIYEHESLVKMCEYEKEEIKPVLAILVEENDKLYEKATHWAWWDFKENDFSMIHPDYLLLDMCFPYGVKADVKAGRGKIVRIIVIGPDNT